MKKYLFFIFLISICLSQETEKHGDENNKESKEHLSKSGEHLVEYFNGYWINTGIAFFGFLVYDYGLRNPVETVDTNDDRLDETTMHPTVFAGGLIMIGAFVKQIFNFRKIKLAGEELKKAGNKL